MFCSVVARTTSLRLALVGALMLAPALALPVAAQDIDIPQQDYPVPIARMVGLGAKAINLGTVHGMQAWVVMPKFDPKRAAESATNRIFYVTPDGAALLTDMYAGSGKHLTPGHLKMAESGQPVGPITQIGTQPAAAQQAVAQQAAPALDIAGIAADIASKTHQIAVGNPQAPAELFMVADALCAHCGNAWNLLLPHVKAGNLFIRLIPVISSQESGVIAATALQSTDPAAVWEQHELSRKGGAQPIAAVTVDQIDPKVARALLNNNDFASSRGLVGTPFFIWKDKAGAVQYRNEGFHLNDAATASRMVATVGRYEVAAAVAATAPGNAPVTPAGDTDKKSGAGAASGSTKGR